MDTTKKSALIDAAIAIVAENGLHNFSMKQVTQRVGTSEALIYKHFSSKENLLQCCFESIHRTVGNLFSGQIVPLEMSSRQELLAALQMCWSMYFSYLVKNGDSTIFYFTYRDSVYVPNVMELDTFILETHFKAFDNLFASLDQQLHIYRKSSKAHIWTYIMDTSGIFAKRVIRGELPHTPESIQHIWNLIAGGLQGLLPEDGEM